MNKKWFTYSRTLLWDVIPTRLCLPLTGLVSIKPREELNVREMKEGRNGNEGKNWFKELLDILPWTDAHAYPLFQIFVHVLCAYKWNISSQIEANSQHVDRSRYLCAQVRFVQFPFRPNATLSVGSRIGTHIWMYFLLSFWCKPKQRRHTMETVMFSRLRAEW